MIMLGLVPMEVPNLRVQRSILERSCREPSVFKFFYIYFILFLCVGLFCLYIYLYVHSPHACQLPSEARKGDQLWAVMQCWGLNLCPLEGQPVLLLTELSLSLGNSAIWRAFWQSWVVNLNALSCTVPASDFPDVDFSVARSLLDTAIFTLSGEGGQDDSCSSLTCPVRVGQETCKSSCVWQHWPHVVIYGEKRND